MKRYALPVLLAGLALAGAGTAYAALLPGSLPEEALSGFSADERAAIAKAEKIRAAAEAEAREVLEEVGITEEEMREAMHAFHEEHRAALDEALDDGDFEAFKELARGGPLGDTLTKEAFEKLVEIRALEKSGDPDGADKLRKEMRDAGLLPAGGMGPHGPRRED